MAKKNLNKKLKPFLGAITVIGFILALYSFFTSPSKKEMEKLISVENKKVIEYINRNPKDSIESLQQKAMFKKNTETLKSLENLYENYQKQQTKHDQKLDSILNELDRLHQERDEQKTIAKNIANLGYKNWEQMFPYGYAIFSIGNDLVENKFVVESKRAFKQIQWDSLKVVKLDINSLTIVLPTIIDEVGRNIFYGNTFGINRKYSSLNKFVNPGKVLTQEFGLSVGLLADNYQGIIGIVGFTNSGKNYEKEPILNLMALK